MSKERPILFSAPMVRAILEGRKAVTRRVQKVQPHIDASGNFCVGQYNYGQDLDGTPMTKHFVKSHCPYGQPGDRLWVRETWYCDHTDVQRGPYLQPADMIDLEQSRADGELVYAADGLEPYEQDQPIWKPSIHMPRWASRILLEITDVRVERLQDIITEQIIAEGLSTTLRENDAEVDLRLQWRDLWESTGGAWDANPWVWALEFKRVTP